MAFNEALKQRVDLLGVAELLARQKREKEERDAQQALLAEQVKSMQTANKKAELELYGPKTMTVPLGPKTEGSIGMGLTEKQFLHDAPGYITGVTPAQAFGEKAATNRAMINAMASSGRYGGRGGVVDGELSGAEVNDKYANPNYQGGYAKGSPALAEMLAQQAMQKQSQDRLNVERVKAGEPLTPGAQEARDYQEGTGNTATIEKILEDRSAAQQATSRADELSQTKKTIYNTPEFQLLNAKQKAEALKYLPGLLEEADALGQEPNFSKYLKSFKR